MKTLSSIFILLCASHGALGQNSPKAPSVSPTPIPQQFRILAQPDAPLRLVSAAVTWATPSDRVAVQVFPLVENISQQAGRAFATRRDMNPATGAKSCLGTPALPAKGLLPGEKTGTSTWQNVTNFDHPPAIWIDFVELSDGTRWGADECQIGELIDGGRVGGRMQRDQLLRIFREKGANALMAFIHENFQKKISEEEWKRGVRPILPIWPPAGHSRRWEEGFSSGSLGVIGRVIEAERKWGPDEIEHELLRPIGPSEKEKKSP